jgi:hypothetical protein
MIVSKYKVNILVDKIVRIIVFYGYYHDSIDELNSKFTNNPRSIEFNKAYNNSDDFDPEDFIFSDEELSNIEENDIPVSFIDLLINMDDNIQNIKNKIFLASYEFPTEEMYLMSKIDDVYETLGQPTVHPANPYEVSERTPFMLAVNNKCITKTENNNIYLCYAQYVVDINQSFADYILENYYPLLPSFSDRSALLEKNKETVDSLISFYRSVDMFFDVYQNRTKNLNYILPLFSFKQIDFTVENSQKIPLQSIFNISHASETIPLIKYIIPKTTNILRLYSKETAIDGRKIPILPFSAITKINGYVEKYPSVCYFVKKPDYFFLFQLMETGNMRFFMEFSDFMDKNEILERIQEGIYEVFEPLRVFFKKSRISPPVLEDWDDIKFTHLEYQTKLRERIFDIKNITMCISKIFIIETVKPTNIGLRYKRISGFNVQNSKEAFVLNNEKQGTSRKEIIDGLMNNYQISKSDALSFYTGFVSQLKLREKVKKRDYEINNSGVLINIDINKLENNITIRSDELNYPKAIKPLFMIMDSIIRIRKEEDTNYPIENINAICSIQIKEPVIQEEIIKVVEPLEIETEIVESPVEKPEISKKQTMALLSFLDSDSEEETEMAGGNKESERRELLDNEEHVEGLNGQSLNNYFKKRMEEYDSKIFVNDKPDGKYKGYSSNCQSNVRRQPVILDKSELDNINQSHPGFLQKKDVLEYTTEKGEELFYICPRYWCLLDDSVMTQEEVDSGQCGKIIPHGSNTIPEGHYVYEFFHPDEHGTREKYIKHGPGIVTNKQKKTCLPCCFKKWDTPNQIKKINECKNKGFKLDEDIEVESPKEKKEKRVTETIIRSPEKFPLDEFTWGYLPVSIELFFGEFNIDCQVSRTNTDLKANHVCILRHGIEYSKNKSFIACISDIKNMYNFNGKLKNEKPHTVANMIDDMLLALNLDIFISLQNGSLIETFSKIKKTGDFFEKYKETTIYQKLFTNPPMEGSDEYNFFLLICTAYENYIDFLKGNDYVDYTYTWDLIAKPNDHIFQNGINLIIFELMDNDDTNKIELICPTNHYSSEFYDTNKKTIIILKKGEFFEPLYLYKPMNQYKAEATAYFDTKRNSTLSQKFKDVLTKIIKHRLESCAPLASLPDVYKFDHPVSIFKLLHSIKHLKNYEIVFQITNLRGKVIGLGVKNQKMIGFVPCYPNSIIPYTDIFPYQYIFINDFKWNNYRDTIDFLTNLNAKDSTIQCGISFQVVEEDHVVGFLTQTNQFIQIDPPINITEKDDIPILDSYNYNTTDKELLEDNDDMERMEYVDKIKTETELENMFLSYFIYLLSEPLYEKTLEQIITLSNDNIMFESDKKSSIEKLLKEMVDIRFIEEFTEEDKKKTLNCFVEECDSILFPKINLINGTDNEKKYYDKLTNYITKYPIVKQQIKNPNLYLMFTPTKLSINNDELYIMQQFLTKEYFDNLEPRPPNAYNDYDNIEPLIKPEYDNSINLKKTLQPLEMVDYEEKTEPIHSIKWRNCFPSSYKEIYYVPVDITKNNEFEKNKLLVSCTYHFAIQLMNKKGSFSESSIVKILYEEYMNIQLLEYLKRYHDIEKIEDIVDMRNRPPIKEEYSKEFKEYFDKIIDLLKIEGKNGIAKIQLQKKIHPQVVLNNMINDDNYFLSVVDLWLLLKNIGMSVVFISSFNIKIMDERHKHNFTANMTDEDIAFIVVPGLGENKIPTFKYISKGGLVPKNELLCDIEEPINFTDFLINYKIESKTEYKKQKPRMVIIDDSNMKPKRKMKIIDSFEPEFPAIQSLQTALKPKRKLKIVDSPEPENVAIPKTIQPLQPTVKPKRKLKIVDSPEPKNVAIPETIQSLQTALKPKRKLKIVDSPEPENVAIPETIQQPTVKPKRKLKIVDL